MKTYLVVFLSVLVAEIGDKTQLAIVLFATDPAASKLELVLGLGHADGELLDRRRGPGLGRRQAGQHQKPGQDHGDGHGSLRVASAVGRRLTPPSMSE
jgi:hypothetical protein